MIKPVQSVVIICEETERCFECLLASTDGKLLHEAKIQDAIATAVLRSLDLANFFPELSSHMFDTAVTNNHIFTLIKAISCNFCTILLHHLGKESTAKLAGKRLRKQLTKPFQKPVMETSRLST